MDLAVVSSDASCREVVSQEGEGGAEKLGFLRGAEKIGGLERIEDGCNITFVFSEGLRPDDDVV